MGIILERFVFLIGILLGFSSLFWASVSFANSYDNSFHKIKEGETLWSISRQYRVSVQDLTSSNSNLSATSLMRGQFLRIPKNSSNHVSKQKFPNQEKEYQVQSGDSLWNIAQRFQVSVWEIQKRNGLSGTSIRKGQILLLPDSYVQFPKQSPQKREDYKFSSLEKLNTTRHSNQGIWLSANNSELRANEEGKVIFLGFLRGYGPSIFLEHPTGQVSIFSSKGLEFRIQLGTRIQTGQLLGTWKKKQGKKKQKEQFFLQVWKNSQFQDPKDFFRVNFL